MRYPAISPDGTKIVFSYKGDLYLVNSEGGQALPVTLHDSYDFMPVWSKDGNQIAFASDRYGNFDVFVMPASGGTAKRLTYHSANDFPSDFSVDNNGVIFSSSRLDDADNQQFPSRVLPELYQISIEGGMPKRVLTIPAEDAKYNNNGDALVFHDRKGYEDAFRKHHTSSIARDVWIYNKSKDSYTQLTTFKEKIDPLFLPLIKRPFII